MTILRMLRSLAAALAVAASSSALAGDAAAPAASAPPAARSAEATKARQEADRQRLVAKLRAETPKTNDKPKGTGTVLDLPIFNRYNRP